VVRDAGQRYLVAFAHLPGGQDDLQFPRSRPRVIVKGLIEVTQAEKDDGVGVLLLDLEVLAADGGDVFFHSIMIVLYDRKKGKERINCVLWDYLKSQKSNLPDSLRAYGMPGK
jgi:hypothetical protein